MSAGKRRQRRVQPGVFDAGAVILHSRSMRRDRETRRLMGVGGWCANQCHQTDSPLKVGKVRRGRPIKDGCGCATVSDASMVPSEMRPDRPNRSWQVERCHSVVSSLARPGQGIANPPSLPLLDEKGQDRSDFHRLGKSQLAPRVARHGARVNSSLLVLFVARLSRLSRGRSVSSNKLTSRSGPGA